MSGDYCYCDYENPPEFSCETIVKRAREKHKCDECRGPILPGESYRRFVGKWDGQVSEWIACSFCLEMEQWAMISVPCFCTNFGELHENVRAMVDDVRFEVPGFVYEWGRRAVAIRRRGGRP